MIPSKVNLLLKTYFKNGTRNEVPCLIIAFAQTKGANVVTVRFMIIRTFKSIVQPKIPFLDERRSYATDMRAILRPSSYRKTPAPPPVVEYARIPRIVHRRPRQEIFERWSRTRTLELFKWLRIGI